jgi:CheY-like chemotaxis protein
MPSFRYRVLVVDDEEDIRSLATALLESKNYEVLSAANGFEAIDALKHALPDIVISDLRMPRMSGFELLSVIRRRFPHIPVIAISGDYASTTVPESVLADAFFQKSSYTPELLLNKIAELIEQLPPRPRIGRHLNAPVWTAPSVDGKCVSVACHCCLRTFPVQIPKNTGVQTALCTFCHTEVLFQMTDHV